MPVSQTFQTLSQRFKQHQKRNGLLIGGALVILIAMVSLFDKSEPPKLETPDKAPLHDLTKTIEDKNVWMFQATKRLEEQEKKQTQLLQDIQEIKKSLTHYSDELKKSTEANTAVSPAPEKPITTTVTAFSSVVPPPLYYGSQPETTPPSFAENLQKHSPGIFSEFLALNSSLEKETPHIDSYIPAGSYARAVLLSGVDVSAGISSQTVPKPVLLRLVHKGSLPNKAVGKMKDCRIIAAAYGDLSSERAYMRLEKLSCTEQDGHVIETDVDGYISGEDGKNGIRGNVVMRDAEVLRRGFMGGLLSGLGKASSSSFSSTSISPFGSINTSNAKGADIFKQAGAEGAGGAFELMAKYNIQRAEQYQPVIQISAGRVVDVVFHSGSPFGEKRVHDKKANSQNSLPAYEGSPP
jgi:conjugal transfer pilus assembly protein TraB